MMKQVTKITEYARFPSADIPPVYRYAYVQKCLYKKMSNVREISITDVSFRVPPDDTLEEKDGSVSQLSLATMG